MTFSCSSPPARAAVAPFVKTRRRNGPRAGLAAKWILVVVVMQENARRQHAADRQPCQPKFSAN